jgi:hypothetical protein
VCVNSKPFSFRVICTVFPLFCWWSCCISIMISM